MKTTGKHEVEKRIAGLYRDYRSRIWYLANQRLENEHDAEDMVQEVFLFLIQNKEKLAKVPESETDRFLFALVRFLCEKRQNQGEVSSYGVKNIYQENVGGSVTPEQIVIGKEMLGSLRVCFARLPENSQALLRYRLANGSSSAAMADRLHISENTLDARVSRVRKKLKKLWMKEGKWDE